MINKHVRVLSSATRGLAEPSHIHIARPSRLPRPKDALTSVDRTADELREIDPTIAQVTLQTA